MRIKPIIFVIAALALATGLTVKVSAGEKDTEKQLLLTDTPAPVQAAIRQFAGSNTIEKITSESEDNKVIYEASVKIHGGQQAVEVLADGTVKQTEKSVALSDTPPAVQAAIKKFAGTGIVNEIVEETAGSKKKYEAAVMIDGKKKEADIAPDGTIQNGEEKEEREGHKGGDKD